jgi:dsRNA-specific ribonuclease
MLSSAANMYTMAAVDENGAHLGVGTAITKKQAEQLAAKEAIKRIT